MRRTMIVVLLFAALPGGTVQAAVVGGGQAQAAVETWLQIDLAPGAASARVERLEPYVAGGRTAAYIAHLAGGGYCLVSADDDLVPVRFYCPDGDYDPGNQAVQGILESMAGRLTWLQEARRTGDGRLAELAAVLQARKAEWADLEAGRLPVVAPDKADKDLPLQVELPLSSAWGQGIPYSADCPDVPTGEHVLVGCVATAMAQIMYYWQWPPTGYSIHTNTYDYRFATSWIAADYDIDPNLTGDFWATRLRFDPVDLQLEISGYWDDSLLEWVHGNFDRLDGFGPVIDQLYGRLTPASSSHTANFAAASYDFAAMTDDPTDPLSAAGRAVAELSYHAGVAVDMDWGLASSGAFTRQAGLALADHFRYDPDQVYRALDDDLIVDEMYWLRPVQVRGEGVRGGHSWVIFGSYTNYVVNIYKMNLGWDGSAIGWYSFDQVPDGFTEQIEHITGIAPAGQVRFVGVPFVEAGQDGSPANPYADIADAMAETPAGGTIVINAGYELIWAGGGVRSEPLTIKGLGVTISAAP